MAAVLHGQVDQIILTGGIAYNPNTEKYLKEYLGFIAPITVYPGEDELLALCQGRPARDDRRREAHGVLIPAPLNSNSLCPKRQRLFFVFYRPTVVSASKIASFCSLYFAAVSSSST